MKKSDILTVGQMARLSGVNIKSLHYYDRIGVLSPAYRDPETGYRYYEPGQLGTLEAIRFCTQLDIPLKNFSSYCIDGHIQAAELLSVAQDLARQKIASLQGELLALERLKEDMALHQRLIEQDGMLEYCSKPAQYLTRPVVLAADGQTLHQCVGELHAKALQDGLHPGYCSGQLSHWCEGKELSRSIFLQVWGDPGPGTYVLELPALTWSCLHAPESRFEDASALFGEQLSSSDESLVMEFELLPNSFESRRIEYLLQCASWDSIQNSGS